MPSSSYADFGNDQFSGELISRGLPEADASVFCNEAISAFKISTKLKNCGKTLSLIRTT
jgi:hypothetical protein